MRPPMEEMFTIVPRRWRRIVGSTSWVSRARPKMFTSNCRRASSIGTSSTAPYEPYPALLTSTSMRP